MRLKNMYYICRENLNVLIAAPDIKSETDARNVGIYKLSRWDKFKKALDQLQRIECLARVITNIKGINSFTDSNNSSITLTGTEYQSFAPYRTELQWRVQSICDLCASLGFKEVDCGFDMKLPPTQDLRELSNCIKDMALFFEQCPYLSQDGDKIRFETVDMGSTWLTFFAECTGTTFILNRLAAIVDKAMIIRSHFLTTKQQEQQLRAMGAKSDLIDNMIQMHKKIGELMIESCAIDLQNTLDPDLKNPLYPESNERLKNSIKLLGEWMSKGLEIYASVDAPQEVQALFPPVEQQKISSSTVALLKETLDSNSGEKESG